MTEKAFDPKVLKEEIETLIVNQGPLAGENFVVLPWQMEVLEAIAAHREVALSVARAAGKSTLCAALACSAITPGKSLFQPRGQIILTAASMQQARITFEHILEFMRPIMHREEGGELKLKRNEWKLLFNSHHMEIVALDGNTTLKVIGADPKRAHGLAPTLVVADEPAQWESGGDMHYAALRTSLGKQRNPRFLLIGTRPRSPHHFFSRLLYNPPPSVYSIVHAATRDDVKDGKGFTDKIMRKANPSFDHLEAVRIEMREMASDAKKLGGLRRSQFYALYLNMGTSESDQNEEVIDEESWELVTSAEQPDRAGPVAIGVDLGGGSSLTAVAFYWPDTGRLECHGALPSIPSLEDRGQADGIGTAYEEMVEQGVLHIHGQRETRNGDFLRERFSYVSGYEWLGVASDRYKKTAIQQALLEAGESEELLVDRAVGRGADGWGDLEAFRAAVLEQHVKPGINLALEHAMTSAVVRRDSNGNSALDKSHQRGRIDVLQAVIHAVGLGERHRRPPESQAEFDVSQYVAAW